MILKKKIANKHSYLRIKEENTLYINANIYFTKNDALKLIHNQKDWIKKINKSFIKRKENINSFLLFGKYYRLDSLGDRNLDELYKEKTKEIIPKLVEKFSKEMKLYPSSIKYRKNKRTWGSCNYKNGLNFNIMLAQFPILVIEYVVIHELAHIKHKNHSKSFWNLVKKYCSDYKNREKLLKSFL